MRQDLSWNIRRLLDNCRKARNAVADEMTSEAALAGAPIYFQDYLAGNALFNPESAAAAKNCQLARSTITTLAAHI
jgi:hypothetical protein